VLLDAATGAAWSMPLGAGTALALVACYREARLVLFAAATWLVATGSRRLGSGTDVAADAMALLPTGLLLLVLLIACRRALAAVRCTAELARALDDERTRAAASEHEWHAATTAIAGACRDIDHHVDEHVERADTLRSTARLNLQHAQAGRSALDVALRRCRELANADHHGRTSVRALVDAAAPVESLVATTAITASDARLLAINAAVAAARAGAGGAPFARVADEARSLSVRADALATELDAFAKQLQKSARDATANTATADGKERAERDTMGKAETAVRTMANSSEELGQAIARTVAADTGLRHETDRLQHALAGLLPRPDSGSVTGENGDLG
jgi:methyl-accepting chemotaxis protein